MHQWYCGCIHINLKYQTNQPRICNRITSNFIKSQNPTARKKVSEKSPKNRFNLLICVIKYTMISEAMKWIWNASKWMISGLKCLTISISVDLSAIDCLPGRRFFTSNVMRMWVYLCSVYFSVNMLKRLKNHTIDHDNDHWSIKRKVEEVKEKESALNSGK